MLLTLDSKKNDRKRDANDRKKKERRETGRERESGRKD